MEDLNKRVINIELRNKRVECDKAWETSKTRKIIILVFTYIFAVLYLTIADTTNPYFGALVPCGGFFLSTLSAKSFLANLRLIPTVVGKYFNSIFTLSIKPPNNTKSKPALISVRVGLVISGQTSY